MRLRELLGENINKVSNSCDTGASYVGSHTHHDSNFEDVNEANGGATNPQIETSIEPKEVSVEETLHGDEFFEKYGILSFDEGVLQEAEYHGRKVTLNKPMRGDVKKFKVYVKDEETGNIKKVNFGDPEMRIKKYLPSHRKSFRARHHCDTDPGPKTGARYWSCKKW